MSFSFMVSMSMSCNSCWLAMSTRYSCQPNKVLSGKRVKQAVMDANGIKKIMMEIVGKMGYLRTGAPK